MHTENKECSEEITIKSKSELFYSTFMSFQLLNPFTITHFIFSLIFFITLNNILIYLLIDVLTLYHIYSIKMIYIIQTIFTIF